MDYLLLGFLTGLSLILAIGAQNVFVIEQGLKKQYVFIVCLICSISDFLLIFLGIFLFQYLNNFFTPTAELIFNILLLVFLLHFIWVKIKTKVSDTSFNIDSKTNNLAYIGVAMFIIGDEIESENRKITKFLIPEFNKLYPNQHNIIRELDDIYYNNRHLTCWSLSIFERMILQSRQNNH